MTEEDLQMNDAGAMMMKQQNLPYLDKWDEQSFSFLDFLQTSSVYDFISDKSMMTDEECGDMLEKHRDEKTHVKPHIAINDLNNSKDEPYLNKPKPAIEIGIEFDF